jgi:hypothetical protein
MQAIFTALLTAKAPDKGTAMAATSTAPANADRAAVAVEGFMACLLANVLNAKLPVRAIPGCPLRNWLPNNASGFFPFLGLQGAMQADSLRGLG